MDAEPDTHTATASWPALCASAARTLTTHISFSGKTLMSRHMTMYAAAPPAAENMSPEKPPANALPRMSLTTSTAPASLRPSRAMVTSVTMFARPSFTPGTGTTGGICASATKIVSATAVSAASRASFFVFVMAQPPLSL